MLLPRSPAAWCAAIVTALLVLVGGATPVAADPATDPDREAGDRDDLSRALVEARRSTSSEVTTPLSVELSQISPGVLPRRGSIRLSGTVTNLDDETWYSINLYAFLGSNPMRSTAELAEAAEVVPEADVGSRLTGEGPGDRIEEIPPGDSAPFSFTVPRSLLEREDDGAYWFGVHAMGTNSEGRDNFADGRARTFLPKVTGGRRNPVRTSLMLPLRHRISYTEDGSLAEVEDWAETLSVGGQLRSLVDLGASADGRPVSWVVDPALIDAVWRLAAGNPPRETGDTVEENGEEDGEDDTGESADARSEPSAASQAAAAAAESWLDRLRRTVEGGDELLTLPYGDVDVDAAHDHAPGLLEQAFARSSPELRQWNADPTPVVVPPEGYLSDATFEALPEDAVILLSDRALAGPPTDPEEAEDDEAAEERTSRRDRAIRRGTATIDGHRVLVTSTAAAQGGPGPNPRDAPLAVRQRILAEAAVRAPEGEHLVVALDAGWHPESATGFFPAMDVPWLETETVSSATRRRGPRLNADAVYYPFDAAAAELDGEVFAAARGLAEAGSRLQRLLAQNDQVGEELGAQALSSASYATRETTGPTQVAVAASRRWVEDRLSGVRIDAPVGVTLTSTSGSFAVMVDNQLSEPVRVGVEVTSDRPVSVTLPQEIEIGGEDRARVLIEAETSEGGIHNLGLAVTDSAGEPLGSSDTLALRSAQVSGVIWWLMAGGGVLLFGAIAVRVVRRFRGPGSTGATDEPTEATDEQ